MPKITVQNIMSGVSVCVNENTIITRALNFGFSQSDFQFVTPRGIEPRLPG